MTVPNYSQPAALDDQWPVTSVAAGGLAAAPLEAMTTAIQAGDFKKNHQRLDCSPGAAGL